MQATQILLHYNYHMITASVMVILCMIPLLENMVVPWRCPADTEPPALVTSTTTPKLCCQRTNGPIWLLMRQRGRCGELRGLDESLQLHRHLYLLVSLLHLVAIALCLLWNRRFTLGWSGEGESAVMVLEPLLAESFRSSQYPLRGGAVGGGQGQHRRLFCVCFGLSPPTPPPHHHHHPTPLLSQLLTLDHQSVCLKALSVIWRWEIGRGKRWRCC